MGNDLRDIMRTRLLHQLDFNCTILQTAALKIVRTFLLTKIIELPNGRTNVDLSQLKVPGGSFIAENCVILADGRKT